MGGFRHCGCEHSQIALQPVEAAPLIPFKICVRVVYTLWHDRSTIWFPEVHAGGQSVQSTSVRNCKQTSMDGWCKDGQGGNSCWASITVNRVETGQSLQSSRNRSNFKMLVWSFDSEFPAWERHEQRGPKENVFMRTVCNPSRCQSARQLIPAGRSSWSALPSAHH